jgi:hypothetical protein
MIFDQTSCFNSSLRIIAGSLLVLTLGCAETDSDKLGDAQFCLDEVPVSLSDAQERASRVNACLSKLGSVSSKEASLIRCSANFLIEGFGSPQKLTSAMEELNTGGGSGTVAMMNVLKFSSQASADANSEFAEQTFNHCQAAGNPGYVLIASFARIATTLSKVAGILNGGLDDGEVSSLLATESPQIIGETAIVAYQASCSEGENANTELCTQLGAAIQGGASSAEIGTALLNGWKNGPT